MIEIFGWFLIAFGSSLVGIALYIINRPQPKTKFHSYVDDLQSLAGDLRAVNSIENHGELYFRDKEGHLCHTKIVIDHSIPPTTSMLPNLKEGEELIVFSAHAAQDLQARGIPLDAILTTLLRDRGRIN